MRGTGYLAVAKKKPELGSMLTPEQRCGAAAFELAPTQMRSKYQSQSPFDVSGAV
jgi:hypothetical protein